MRVGPWLLDSPAVFALPATKQDFCQCCDDKGGENGDKDCQKSYAQKCAPPKPLGTTCSTVNPDVRAEAWARVGLCDAQRPCIACAHPLLCKLGSLGCAPRDHAF